MRLTAIDRYISQRIVGREETLDLFRHYSKPYYPDEKSLMGVVEIVGKLMDRALFEQVTVRAENEPFYANYLDMTRRMIAESGVQPKDIDLVIYCGVGRGYREPATAYQMASRLGLKKAECFDIIDACNGWGHTTRIVERLLRTGYANNVLILSLEFNRSPRFKAGVDRNYDSSIMYSIRTMADLEWRVWGATVGETGTATILSRDDNNGPWYYDYASEPDDFQDCAFTLANHREYDLEPMPLEQQHGGEEFFYAFGKRIGESVKSHLIPQLQKVPHLLEEAKVVIPHSLSAGVYDHIFRMVGVNDKALYIFKRYGNCVSNGVPVGVATAIKEHRLQRGDRAVLVPTGSGSSAGVISFRY